MAFTSLLVRSIMSALIRFVLPTKTNGATSVTDHFEAECDSIKPITLLIVLIIFFVQLAS